MKEAARWGVQGAGKHLGSPCQQRAGVQTFQNALSHAGFTASEEVGEAGFVISGSSTMLGTLKALKKSLWINHPPFSEGNIKAWKMPAFLGHQLPKGRRGLTVGTKGFSFYFL